MGKITTKVFIILLAGILTLPALQTITRLAHERKLGGYTPKETRPQVTYKNYINSSYQDSLEIYVKSIYGFRRSFIRCFNQYNYSLFRKTNAELIVIGEENHLFSTGYIDAALGKTFIGNDSIDSMVSKLKQIQSELKEHGKDILIVIPSSKGTFDAEFIPDYLQTEKTLSNYEYYSEKLRMNHINFIDFNKYFLEIKGSKDYPLYAKHGIHWTNYGAYIAMDSIVQYLEKLRNIDLPDILMKSISYEKPRADDKDITNALNLIWPLRDIKYGYPALSINKNNKDSLKVLVISDSFYYALHRQNLTGKVFYDSEFWYYYRQIKPAREDGTKLVSDINPAEEFEKFDVILLMSNEATLHSFAWGSVQDLYRIYVENQSVRDIN